MTSHSFDSQFELFKQMARRSGISGLAYIDFKPANGFLRIKLNVVPPEYQGMLISSLAQVLGQVSQMLGLEVKFHQDEDGQVGAKA
ncbi:MAG: hypothetical protein FJ006_11785 [Chloroflexi bacterium]|nr:hypothetical protein [Chloroflexota bacterium]